MKPGFGLKINLQNVIRDPIVSTPAAEKVPPCSGETNPCAEGWSRFSSYCLPPSIRDQTNGVNKEYVIGISTRLRVGYADTIGARETMEDKTVIYGSFRERKDEDFFAVFDGHSGSAASVFASKRLHRILERNLDMIDHNDPFSVMGCLHETFLECQEEMKVAKIDCGTTALVSLWIRDKFYIANAGDSRAVACINRREKRMTVDHKPLLPSEKARILKHKGAFLDLKGRVQGRLSVARALGDFLLVPYISCEPEVFGPFEFNPTTNNRSHDTPSVSHDYAFIIFACDGLWDVINDRKAVKVVKQSKTPKEAACALLDRAVKLRSRDNISVIVIFFPGYEPGTYSYSSSTESEDDESEYESDSSSDSSSESDSGSSGSGSGSESSSDSGSSESGSGSSSGYNSDYASG